MDGPSSLPAIDWPAELARHDRWLRTVVLARLGERQAVDDVMQEVSLAAAGEAARGAGQGKRVPVDPAKAAPWLYRVAVTQALLYRRRCGRQRKLTDRFAQKLRPTESDSRTCDPLDWLLADERRQLVRTALERLPPRDAEILLLKHTEDWDYHQIAAHLDIGHSAVETRLHRARKRLRAELSKMLEMEASRA